MVSIQYGDLRAGAISGSSGIFAGHNVLQGFGSVSKRSQAFGSVNGESFRLCGIRSRLEDGDAVDANNGQMSGR
jgi:hypothetical protein